MRNSVLNHLKAHPRAIWFYPICVLVIILLFVTVPGQNGGYTWLYLGCAVLFLYAVRPNSALHVSLSDRFTKAKAFCTVLVALITIAACVLPMDKLPIWNGEIPEHRNQYELMTEAILDGRIDFDYGDEDELAQLENPYDPEARAEAGVHYHWDHAYYNGHYYMYFGIVPVFLVFLPYRVITGASLTTYHATQIFVAFTIAGIFVLFRLLAKLFFKKLPFSIYLALSVAFSVMSVWYSTSAPALYCTAITSALELETWSLYFFIRAVWSETRENRQILFAGIGAVLGALAFGCRPPIALANLLVIPMLAVFLKQRKCTAKLFVKLFFAASPYLVVAAGLMWYNYIRFDDPFEFGQAYQLTVADQSNYQISLDLTTIRRIFSNAYNYFFEVGYVQGSFPYLNPSSVLWNFPILLFGFAVLKPAVWKNMRKTKILALWLCLLVTVLLITAVDIMWSPYLLERYRMDIYFLLGIACFLAIGFWWDTCSTKTRAYLNSMILIFSAFTIVCAGLFCAYEIGLYYPEKITEAAIALHLP